MDIVAYLDNENKCQVTNENLTSAGFEHERKVHRIPPDFPSHPTTESKPRFIKTESSDNSWVDESVVCGADSIDLLALADTFEEIIPNNQMAKYIKSTYDGEILASFDTDDESTVDTFHTADSSSYLPNLSQLTHTFDDSTIDSALEEHEEINKENAHGVTSDESTIDSTVPSTLEHEREEGSDLDIGPDDTFDDLTAKSTLEDGYESESEIEIHPDSTFDDRTSDSTLELKATCDSTFDERTTDSTLELKTNCDSTIDHLTADSTLNQVEIEGDNTFDDFTAYSTMDFEDDGGSETEIDCDSIFDDCTIETVEDFNNQCIVLKIAKEDLPLQLEGFKYDEQRSDIAVIAEGIKPTEIPSTSNTTTLVSMVSLSFLPWLGGGNGKPTSSPSLTTVSVEDNDDASAAIESIKDWENDTLSKKSDATSEPREKTRGGLIQENDEDECPTTIIGVNQEEENKDSSPAILDEGKARGEEKSEESTLFEPSMPPCIEVEIDENEKATDIDEEEDVMEGREHRWEDMKAILKKTKRIERREKWKNSIKRAFKSLRFWKRKAPFYVDGEGEYDLVVTVMN